LKSTATKESFNACLKGYWADEHYSRPVTWAVASDGSILRARIASLVAGLFVFVAMDALMDQVKLASQSLPYSVWVGERFGAAWQLRPVPEYWIETLMLVTSDSLGQNLRSAESLAALQVWMEGSLQLDVVALNTAVLEDLLSAAALVKCGFVKEAYAAEVEAVAAEAVLAPDNAGPIPNLCLADCLHPFRQKPWGSCTVESLHSTTSAAYPARSFVALTAKIPAVSSPPLAFACPLQP
jgi:hypothetical protein